MTDVFKALFGVVAVPVLFALAVLLFSLSVRLLGVDVAPVIAVVVALTPLWLPWVLFFLSYQYWIAYVRSAFAVSQGRVTLRIKLPQEVLKSPQAMESVFSQIHMPAASDNPYNGWFEGKSSLTFSFELVSIGGEVRFYINVPRKKIKNAIEAQLYAQYPGIEIVEEVIDYTAEIPWNPEKYEYMSFRMNKTEAQEFPIKTYIDLGLDKMPKEEEKVEPMAPMIEQLSTLQRHERLWIQILAKPHAKKSFKNGELKTTLTWEKKVREKIDEMLGREPGKKTGPVEFEEQPRLTPGERDLVAAMERNAGKYAYETAIRWIYITETGKFNGDIIAPTLKSFTEYNMIGRNGLGLGWRTDFDFNYFQDPSGKRKLAMKKKELQAYKLREYLRETDKDAPKIFTTEELATIYHIPGRSVVTPGLARITSTRSEAPVNLPTG